MTRKSRDFTQREESDREWMIENTWCDRCGKADLGIIDPAEYEEDGAIFVEGKCRICGSVVRSQIDERDLSE